MCALKADLASGRGARGGSVLSMREEEQDPRALCEEAQERVRALERELQRRISTEAALEEQLKYNEVRAGIWEIATDTCLGEKDLILSILNATGEALRVSRASFLRFDPHRKNAVVEQQWCAHGVASTLGTTVPYWVFEGYFGEPYVETTALSVPSELREIVVPLFEQLGIRSNLMVSWGDTGAPEGFFCISQCDHTRAWKPSERQILSEIVKIVSARAQRMEAEEALRRSEQLYSSILESLSEGIFTMDPRYHYTHWNRAMERISMLPKKTAVGVSKAAWDVFPDFKQQGVDVMMREAMGGRSIQNQEIAIRLQDGSLRVTSQTLVPLTAPDGDIRGVVGVVRDVTALKEAEKEKERLEAQLQYAQRMEAVGTLAGGIAHNFNNLLMGIQGNASLALLETDESHPNHRRLKNIERLVLGGSRLTNQLLEYANKGTCEIKPIDLNKKVMETSETFGAANKHIRIYRDLAPDLWAMEADGEQIEQVLLNLYINAAEAMPTGGDLHVQTANVTDREMRGRPYRPKPGRYVKFTVRDTGVGMDKEAMDRVFEPFFTTKGLGRGTGLGLASAYGIVKGHGGYIHVESEKGQGATFELYFPGVERMTLLETPPVPTIQKGKETVFLVDDEEIVLDVAGEILRKLGYEVLTASNGQEAIKGYERNRARIDVVVLDLIMPDMGGGEAYRRIKKIDPHAKVILSSGYGIDGQAQRIMDLGCNGFLQKPFTMADLSSRIREVMG